jgi:hypothetical protein
MVLTRRSLPRRAILKGVGAALALPFLDAMIPAGAALGAAGAPSTLRKRRLVCIEMVHGSAGSSPIGITHNLWAPAAVGRDFDLAPTSLRSLAVPRSLDHRQQHRLRERGAVHRVGDRRRSRPVERGVPDAGAPAADRRSGR